jgi:hypothetical protein
MISGRHGKPVKPSKHDNPVNWVSVDGQTFNIKDRGYHFFNLVLALQKMGVDVRWGIGASAKTPVHRAEPEDAANFLTRNSSLLAKLRAKE